MIRPVSKATGIRASKRSAQSFRLNAAGSKAEVSGRLRINVDSCFGHYVLTPKIDGFLSRYPDLFVEVIVRDRMGDLVADGFDLGIHFGDPEPSSLICRLLAPTARIR